MKALRGGRAVAFALLQSSLAAAQIATCTDGTKVPSQNPPFYPIPANSSSVVTDPVPSTKLLRTGRGIFPDISVTDAHSCSDSTTAQLPETSTGALLLSPPTLTPTATPSSSNSSSLPTYTLSWTPSSIVTTHSAMDSAKDSSTMPHYSAISISDGPSITVSAIRPPEFTKTPSASDGWHGIPILPSCHLPSKNVTASSTIQYPTTFRTSFVSSSSGRDTTTSCTKQPPASTKQPPSKAPSPTKAPTPAPTKAVSIILRNINNNGSDYNSWAFFETSIGRQADGCGVPVLDDTATRWSDRDAINHPPWPHGTFTMRLFGEDNCQYLNDGMGAGILHCPAMGEGKSVGCREDSEKGRVSAVTQCLNSLQSTRAYHRAVYCEY